MSRVMCQVGTPISLLLLNMTGEGMDSGLLSVAVDGGDAIPLNQSSTVPELFIADALTIDEIRESVVRWTYEGVLVQVDNLSVVPYAPRTALNDSTFTYTHLNADAALDLSVRLFDIDGAAVGAAEDLAYADGAYSVEISTPADAGNYFAVVLQDGVTPISAEYLFIGPHVGSERCFLILAKVDGAITTAVTSADLVISKPDGTFVIRHTTDDSGEVGCELLLGDYVVTAIKSPYVFSTNNWPVTVSAKSSEVANNNFHLVTEWFTPAAYPASALSLCSLYGVLTNLRGGPIANAVILVEPRSVVQMVGGSAVVGPAFKVLSDALGKFSFRISQGISVTVTVSALGLRRTLTVPSGDDALLPVNIFELMSDIRDPFDILRPNIATAPRRV